MRNNLYYGTALTFPERCREPVTIAIAGAVGAQAGTLAYSLISAGVSLAVSAAASWASRALAGVPEAPEAGQITNIRDAAAPAQIVYGTVRKGGVLTYVETTGGKKNGVMHQIITLAGHEVDAIEAIYINDEEVALSAPDYDVTDPGDSGDRYTGAGWVLTEKWMEDNDILEPRIRVLWHRGNQTSATTPFDNDPNATLANTLIAQSATLDSNFVGRNRAFLYITMLYDPEVFANGIPLFSARIRGKRVRNLATGAIEFSANAADVVADYLTAFYGLDEPDTALDGVSFQVAHNVCDEDVPLAAGGTQKRYEINGVFTADRAPASVLPDMMTACAGSLYWGQGLWKLRPGYYTAPVRALSERDLRSGVSIDPRLGMRDAFNTVRGTFVDAAQDWITADYPELRSALFVAADNGVESALDLALPFTTNAAMAQRLAKMTLFRSREEASISADFSLGAVFDLEPGDIVSLSLEKFGWVEKEFEITDWRLVPGAHESAPRVSLKMRETSAAAFAWDGDERDILSDVSILPDPTLNLAVANIQVVPFTRVNEDGTVITGAGVSWDASDNAFITGYEVQYRLLSASAYTTQATPDTSLEIAPLVAGETYEVRVRSVSDSGRKGKWAVETFVAGGDGTTPKAPTSLLALGGVQSVSLMWQDVTQNTDNTPFNDFAYFNVYRSTTTNVANAIYVGATPGRSYVDTGLGDNVTYSYWVTAVDTSGNESAKSNRASATTNFITAAQLVDDIRAQIGAARVDVVASLPSGAGYAAGDFVFRTSDRRLYRWTGSSWEAVAAETVIPPGSITSTQIGDFQITAPKMAANSIDTQNLVVGSVTFNELAGNSVIAGKIATGAVSSDEIAVNSLAAITATLGNVNAGSLNTLTSGTGVQINVPTWPNATYIYQNSASIYGLYVGNFYNASLGGGAGGAAYFTSLDGYTVQVLQTDNALGNTALDAQNNANVGTGNTPGGAGQIGNAPLEGGYAFRATRGSYYANNGQYLPFTGAHEGVIRPRDLPEPGDIVTDGQVIAKRLSDTLTEIHISTRAGDPSAVGVFVSAARFEARMQSAPAAIRGQMSATRFKRLRRKYFFARFNALGEGCINVCGQGGNIEKGDLIITSDMRGKGMRQADDLVRNMTVARAREAVTFDGPEDVRQIACIYLCG